ncbi:MAG: addiction module protein [Limisphaerales bacterium]
MKSLETVAADALELPKDQRFTLALRILSSVEPEPDAAVEAAWDTEIRERIRRYDAGQTPTVSGVEVFAGLDGRLSREH